MSFIVRAAIISIVWLIAFAIGTFGFAQIIGSLQNLKTRSPLASVLTIVIWLAILVGSYFLMKWLVPSYSTVYYIAMGLSFVLILSKGKMK